MSTKDMAEYVAESVLDLRERLSAWKSLAVGRTGQPIQVLESDAETLLGRHRARSKAREYHAQIVKEIHASEDDSALVKTLYEGILQSARIPD